MAASVHPAASHHLPLFIAGPGETDVLMVVMGIVLLVIVLGVGVLFLNIHTLPERIAHKSHKLQFEIVAVLGLLALFTHIHLFWVAGLLLAMVDFPDFGGQLGRMARSLEKMAGLSPPGSAPEASADNADAGALVSADLPRDTVTSLPRAEDAAAPTAAELPELKTGSTRS